MQTGGRKEIVVCRVIVGLMTIGEVRYRDSADVNLPIRVEPCYPRGENAVGTMFRQFLKQLVI